VRLQKRVKSHIFIQLLPLRKRGLENVKIGEWP
jgi:hypothetical protein